MSDCEHAAHIFEKFYLMDEFVSGKACPYCRNAELESDLEYACESIRALEETVGFFEDQNERLEGKNKALRELVRAVSLSTRESGGGITVVGTAELADLYEVALLQEQGA